MVNLTTTQVTTLFSELEYIEYKPKVLSKDVVRGLVSQRVDVDTADAIAKARL